jgi:mRNA-degrading endonuclease toxin of MazEF toxin-antitoxin module
MAERGDVLEFRKRVGFSSDNSLERVVVVQATELNAALPTLIVVPLDIIADPYVDVQLLVRVSAKEAGTRKDAVAIPTHLRFVPSDRFAAGRVGRLRPSTLAQLDDRLRLVLDL